MSRTITKRVPAFLAAVTVLALGAGAVVAQTPAPNAQPRNPAAATDQARPQRSHIEGRIAFLKAELKITDQQNAAFNRVADVLRANDRERMAAREEMHKAREALRQNANAPRPSGIERMETRQKFMAAAAAQTARALEAWKPLYAQLSAEQKQVADELLGGRGGRGHSGHRHHGRA
jgi:hypothetical protein